MACCHHFSDPQEGIENAFSINPASITFGKGCLGESGPVARHLGLARVGLITDSKLSRLEPVQQVRQSLEQQGVDVVVYDEVEVEPTDRSFQNVAQFAVEGEFDGFFSVGGGSVIDTTKAANLYSSYPAEFLTYVNKPLGAGRAVPGALKPHVACPTTCGTGSECTGIAIFDFLAMRAKTGIASPHLRPTRALIDPGTLATLPSLFVAASGFDVLSHALESFTARPYNKREIGENHYHSDRPMSQGANPWSDIGCREALRLAGQYLVRAVTDAADEEARTQMMWAATLAGIAFGNAGVHIPHGMAYAVAGLAKKTAPFEKGIPHGVSVIVTVPAVFEWLESMKGGRHHEAAALLGADSSESLTGRIKQMVAACRLPTGLGPLGYTAKDVAALTRGALPQRRLLDNGPCAVGASELDALFSAAMGD